MKVILSNLSKDFNSLRGKILALKNINLTIQHKEFFVLLGPSGCGKSTLLNLIAGLEKPSKGEIKFDDILVSKDKKILQDAKERNIGMVFQSYALYPHLNIFENIAFPLHIKKTNNLIIKKEVEKVADLLEITVLLKSKPAELSGGERQRVAIARAIIKQPELLLLDEPLSNLDASLRLSTRTELKKLQKKLGITTIYVTHDQIEAISLGDKISVLKKGEISQTGTPKELYEKPANTFIATFIGSPQMNLINASFFEEKGIIYINIENKKLKLPENKIQSCKNLNSNNFILGIRPENIQIKQTNTSLKVKINSLENLGKDMFLYVLLGKQKLTLLTNELKFKENDILDIDFDLEKIQIFEKEN